MTRALPALTLLVGLAAPMALPAQMPADRFPADMPQQVQARIADLDARCRAAGGRPNPRPYLFIHDYSGDGVPDYLLSEGRYGCTGQEGVFRVVGASVLEIFVTEPDGAAFSAWRSIVAGYRLVQHTPLLVQVVKVGQACGASPLCGYQLRYDAAGRRFDAVPVSGAQAKGAAAPPASGGNRPVIAPAPAAPAPRSQAEMLAECRAERQRAGLPAGDIKQTCGAHWSRIVASRPVARAMIGLLQRAPAALQGVAAAKAALPTVRWAPRNDPPVAPQTIAANGNLGDFHVAIGGGGRIETAAFSWQESGGVGAFEVPAALRAEGLSATRIACGSGGDAFGDSESEMFAVGAPGWPPVALEINRRIPALGGQIGWYNAILRAGPVPTLASLRGANRNADRFEAVQWGPCR
ncbi:hypothetical protein [Sphingomonas sanxanigenens]|uniref:hypothetical protein n=1 Tax=Sphingomonas sanxanigenens TaxID=397260 RepID=UPI0004B05A04|nr:hypothetical protein [Sphingomonas sanxanigenens]